MLRDNSRNRTHSLVRTAGVLVLLTSIVTMAHGSPPRTHAAIRGDLYILPCSYACSLPRPAISVTNLVADSDDNSQMEVDSSSTGPVVSGTNFTQGDPIHIELIAQAPYSGLILAAGDTHASFGLNFPLGNGRFVPIPGGRFTISLVPDPASQVACDWEELTASVVAVDQRTGASVSINPIDITAWWLRNQVIESCPTNTPTPGAM